MSPPTAPPVLPVADPSRHRSSADLEVGLRALAPVSPDAGRVALIVRRDAEHRRETPPQVRLDVNEGVPDDAWGRQTTRKPESQLAVMRRDVAELIANGQPLTLFGDNLFVDLDLSKENLPAGSRLRVGEAVVEVTPMAHDGCSKFNARFGADALRFVNAKPTRNQNLRGIYWRVIEPGEIKVGDSISVLSRGG